MAEHRRSLQALGRVSRSAALIAERTRHLHLVPGMQHEAAPDAGANAVTLVSAATQADFAARTVVSFAAERARRAGHPAGSGRFS